MHFVTVGGNDYEVVMQFEVLYSGWECDPYGYVVKTSEGLRLVHSSHGTKYFTNASEFLEFIEDYKKVIEETIKAIALVEV